MKRGRRWAAAASPGEEPTPRRRRRLIVAALIAPVGIAAGLGAVAWGEHAIRGSGGVTATPARRLSTPTTVTTAPPGTSAPSTTAATTTTTTAPRLPAPRPPMAAGVPATRPPTAPPPPPPPPVVPDGPSVSLSQAAGCIQVGDTNHVEANVSAPAGLGSVGLQVVHSTDGTTYDGPMNFDGTAYAADVGPFNLYLDDQTVTWTVTVTDGLGRTAQAAKQFTVSLFPCP